VKRFDEMLKRLGSVRKEHAVDLEKLAAACKTQSDNDVEDLRTVSQSKSPSKG
jgi:hypothetical protein